MYSINNLDPGLQFFHLCPSVPPRKSEGSFESHGNGPPSCIIASIFLDLNWIHNFFAKMKARGKSDFLTVWCNILFFHCFRNQETKGSSPWMELLKTKFWYHFIQHVIGTDGFRVMETWSQLVTDLNIWFSEGSGQSME